MSRGSIQRQLSEIATRLRSLRAELALADEQLSHLTGMAEDTRIRALVSETPLSSREHQEAERHAEAMRKHREAVAAEISELERKQDQLLDELTASS